MINKIPMQFLHSMNMHPEWMEFPIATIWLICAEAFDGPSTRHDINACS